MAKGTTFNEAAEAIGDIIEKLPPSEKVPLLGMAAGFALSLVGAGDRQHARDRLGSRVAKRPESWVVHPGGEKRHGYGRGGWGVPFARLSSINSARRA
jgi:hypothetical protein